VDWEARFRSKIQRGDYCWQWTGSVARRIGYGKFWRDGKTLSAHRVAYELFVGPIPDGLQLDHLCRNRLCVRPEHLQLVTVRENLLRGHTHAAANAAKSHCPAGHPYDERNTYRAPDGSRMCRPCMRERDRRRYWQRKARSVAE
jgi:hypothetical protein